MFTIKWSPRARRDFDALQAAGRAARDARLASGQAKSSKPEGLYKQVRKALQLLAANPRHPGLRTHEFHSLKHPFDSAGKVFEAYAQNQTPGACRIFWCYGPGQAEMTIIAITPHP
jgi:hypothetical protein